MHQEQTPQKQADAKFGERIKKAREAAGLSQRDLAAELKKTGFSIDPSAVTRIERGERPVKVAEAQAVAKILRTTVSSLLEEASRRPLEYIRTEANVAMHEARASLNTMLSNMALIQFELRRDPRLMTLFNDEAAPPASADSYLEWVRARMQGLTRNWEPAFAATAEDAVVLRNIARSFIGHLVEVEPSAFEWLEEGETASHG